jgi:hypothetical protein
MRTTNSCAVAAHAPRMRNVVHPDVRGLRLEINGTTVAAAAAATRRK